MLILFELELEQMDVKIIFLHGELERICIYKLKGFIAQAEKDHVCLLKKLTYS